MNMQRKSDVDTRNGNRMMLKNQAVEFKHHAKELSDAVKKAKHVDAWVVAKAERATTDLSDITHYLEGQSEKMADGGRVKYVDKNNIDYSRGSYPHYKRYNNAIGSFAWKYDNRYNEGILYPLDEYDREFYAHIKLKDGEHLFRYKTDGMIGNYFPLVKINLKNALIYFLAHDKNEDDDKNPVFESRGIQSDYIIIEYNDLGIMFSEGGEVNLSKMTDGEAIEHANKILISELGEGANSLFFDSGYAARRFIREYHVRPVEITEEDVRDYFDDDSSMSDEAKEILQKYSDIKHDSDTLAGMRSELEEVGYTFDYDKDNVPYLLRNKMSEEDTMAKGGMMANGGVAKNRKDEIEKQAQFYADESRWSTKPTVSQYAQELADILILKNKLDNKEIKPRDVIGTGYKPQYARGIAYEYIHEHILIYERVIEILREREKSYMQKTDMPKKVSREDIQAAIDALEILAETGNEKAKDAIEGMKLLLEDYPEDSVASASGGNNEDYIINMLKGKYYKVIPEGMQDSDIVVEIKDVRIDDPKYRDRFVSLISGKDGYADERIPLSKIDAFLNGEEIVLRDDKEYYAVKLMGNLAKGGIMAHGGQIESKRDELLDSLYPEIKELFAKNGLKLDGDYGFTDGSNKSYLPYFSHQRVGDTLQKVVVSYYEDGYEVIGEIEIELEDGIEIEVEFPSMGIKEKKEGFMAKGGMMKNVGATFAEKVNAISARLDGMIVPSRLRKDYGRRYNKAEAKLAAQRIAGAMRKNGY